jgi:predicted  nucleic acid-binding Zn-ribbon protein
MAEIEYEGIKLSGGKLLMIIPLLSALGGALWTGFEFYNRLMVAEETLASIDIAEIHSEVNRLDSIYELVQTDLANQIDNLESRLDSEIDEISRLMAQNSTLVRTVENSASETQRDLRNDVYALERQLNETVREIDAEIIAMRDYLESRIEEFLSNPLNNVE